MSADTEMALLDWENEKRDVCDDLHIHFKASGLLKWTDVAIEARRLWGLMFGEDIDRDSAIAGILDASSAQAFFGGIAMVAEAIGVDAGLLESVVTEWIDAGDGSHIGIGAERIIKLCDELKSYER